MARDRRPLPVQQLLEWAFGAEKARLDLDAAPAADHARPGIGAEYVLMQRAVLGCKVDGAGGFRPSSDTHRDAEVIAAITERLPTELGGRRMAVIVAEHARTGTTPDWMPGAVPRVEPKEWKNTRHGPRGRSEPVTSVKVRYRGRDRRYIIRWCPVRLHPHPDQIRDARRGYEAWWRALDHIRAMLAAADTLEDRRLAPGMPPREPWARRM